MQSKRSTYLLQFKKTEPLEIVAFLFKENLCQDKIYKTNKL